MGDIIKANKHITQLGLKENFLGEEGILALLPGIKESNLLYLNISRNEISEEPAKQLIEVLKTKNTIQILDISENMIGDEAGILLADIDSLHIVDMQSNYLGSEAVLTFAKSLEDGDSNLHACNLSLNTIELAEELVLQNIVLNFPNVHLVWKKPSDQPFTKDDVNQIMKYFGFPKVWKHMVLFSLLKKYAY